LAQHKAKNDDSQRYRDDAGGYGSIL
jgi:hypothetical protein